MLKNLFLLNVFFLLIVATTASAQTNVSFVSPGMTPDNIFYNFELIYEDFVLALTPETYDKLNLETQYAAERLAEINTMINSQDYGAAQEAAAELNSLLEATETHVNELITTETGETINYNEFVQGETTVLDNILEIQHIYIENSENAEAIKETLLTNVENGNVDEETAALIINDVQEGVTGVETAIIEQKENLIETVSETNDISHTEVEIAVEEKEGELGTSEIMKNDVTQEEILTLETAIARVELEIAKANEEGKQNEADTMKVLLENAKLKLQIAENAIELGDSSEAFGQFIAAEHLMLNADKISGKTFSDLSDEEISKIKEGLGKEGVDELKERIESVTQKNIEDWEKYKNELIEKYPEKKEYFEKRYEQEKKVGELTKKLGNYFGIEYDKLISEGKTNDEVATEMAAKFSDEYRKVYGEDYIPPGFVDVKPEIADEEGSSIEEIEVEVIPIGEIDEDFFNKYEEGGGFVEDVSYADPATGYQYIYRETGFSYTTQSGETYTVEYPNNYEPPTYSRGDEVYDYSYTTPEGTYDYKYTSTGYEVENPDGTTESITYPEGKYKVVGGGEITQKPTGFEYTSQEGNKINYDYNPEYRHYVANDGKVYIPPEGTFYHSQRTEYDSSGKTYSYNGGQWHYSPDTNAWTSSGGETYTPKATTGAPVGYEGKGTYTTEYGEAWNYDSSSGKWTSSSGKEYSPPPSSYYSYDSNAGYYVDTYGNTYDSSQHTDASGKTWNYDESKGTWSSSAGETWNQYTGTTTDANGQVTETYNTGGYQSTYSGNYYTDGSGSTWSQGSDGTWTSSSGETKSTAEGYVGSNYVGGGGYDSAGNYVGGAWGGYDSSGTYTGGNTYSPESGSGTYSGGTYSGGDTGSYSAPSGGDSGGSAPSGGGTGFTISGFAVKKYRLF